MFPFSGVFVNIGTMGKCLTQKFFVIECEKFVHFDILSFRELLKKQKTARCGYHKPVILINWNYQDKFRQIFYLIILKINPDFV
jgi:hypothetical protein